MSLSEDAPCGHPWSKVVQGALSLACTAQRCSVLKTGERVLEVVFGNESGHNLVAQLSAKLMGDVKAVIDVSDYYEWGQLVYVLKNLKILNDPIRLREIAEWGLTSKNAEVLASANGLLAEATLKNGPL